MKRKTRETLLVLVTLLTLLAMKAAACFGATIAVGPGGDVRGAFSALRDGDTLFVQSGFVDVPRLTPLRGNILITGEPNAVLRSTGDFMFVPTGHNITVRGIQLEGPVLRVMDPVGGVNELRGLWFDKCRFRVPLQGPIPKKPDGSNLYEQWAAIYGSGAASLVDFKMTNCVVEKCETWAFMFWYGWRGLTIQDCEFYHRVHPTNPNEQGRFLKLLGLNVGPPGSDTTAALKARCFGLTIQRCRFDDYAGMCIEYQRGSWQPRIIDCVFVNPRFVADPQSNLDRYAVSAPNDTGAGMEILNNLIISDDPRLRQAIEVGGIGNKIEGNYIRGAAPVGGLNASIAVDGVASTGVVQNNKIVNAPPPYNANGSTAQLINNGPSVQLLWDINRPWPSAGNITPPVNNPPATQPNEIDSLKAQLAAVRADLTAAQQSGAVKDARITQLQVQVRDLESKIAAAKAALN